MSKADSDPDKDSHLDTVRKQLKACFSTAQTTSTFLHQEIRESFPNPSIKIKDIGNVGLPLSSRDIDAVKQASHRAPFGKGTETIVDENVRKTWQIDASDLVCSNPRWDNWVQSEILPKCCDVLGVSPVAKRWVRPELYKMLLYEEGAHFQPHKDTEKAPGMFATLAICLPTEHQGGDLVLRHNNESLTWSSSSSSAFDLSLAAWYADVVHEVKPITSGHRVVLTYNLIKLDQSLQLPAAAAIGDRDGQLRQALEHWSEVGVWNDDKDKEVDFLCHCLEHEYTETSLSLSRLAGADAQLVTRAMHAAQQSDFAVYLGTFERTHAGDCDEDGYGGYGYNEILEGNETEDDWNLQKVVALDGTEVAKDIGISKWEMLDPEVLEGREPDDEDFQGWTGNEGAYTTHWYRSSVMILIPKQKLVSFTIKRIQQYKATVRDSAKERLDLFKAEPESEGTRKDLLDFSHSLFGAMEEEDLRKPYPVPWYGKTPSSGFSTEDKSVLIVCFAWLSIPEMCETVQKFMDEPIKDNFFVELREPFQRSGGIMHYRSFLTGALSSQANLTYLLKALDALVDPSSETARDPEVLSWSQQVIQTALDSQDASRLMIEQDASALMDLCTRFGPSIYSESVLPCAMKHTGQAWFSVPFACELRKAAAETGTNNGLDASQLRKDSSQIVKAIVDNESDVQVARLKEYSEDWSKKTCVERIMSRHSVIELYILMSKEDLESLSLRDSFLCMLVHKMMDVSKDVPLVIADHLVPLARLLATVLAHPATQTESYQKICQLITEIWNLYLRDVVQARPPQPSLVMSPIHGSSNESKEVNRFLADPTRSRYEFRAVEKIRRNMEYDVRREHNEAIHFGTLSTGRPYALVITKRPDVPHKKKLKEWNARASQATNSLLQCPQLIENKILKPSFFTVLPEDSMRIILQTWFKPSAALGYPTQASQSTGDTLTPVSGNASSIVPAKRKASDGVVDLTGA